MLEPVKVVHGGCDDRAHVLQLSLHGDEAKVNAGDSRCAPSLAKSDRPSQPLSRTQARRVCSASQAPAVLRLRVAAVILRLMKLGFRGLRVIISLSSAQRWNSSRICKLVL